MKSGKFCKNPCKICHTPVTKKNGLQCQGACRVWVHFKCLNYTPGKIQDIRAGLIKVLCPCPNCETEDPKEILINTPFSCTNSLCPVNLPPSCEAGCLNSYPIPSFDYDSDSCPDCILPRCPPIAKRPSTPNTSTIVRCSSSDSPSCRVQSQQDSRRLICSSNCSSKHHVDCFPMVVNSNQSRSCINSQNKLEYAGNQQNTCPVSSDHQVPGDNSEDQKTLRSAVQNLCHTMCDLNTQMEDLMVKLEKSTSNINRQ